MSGTLAANPDYVGIGNNFTNPQSLLHLHQPAGNNVFLRFSNAGTGGTNLDGFVIGMLNGNVNGDACLIQYEPNSVRFFQRDLNIVGPAPEKMQLTYGGQMEGGTADGLRIFNPGYAASVPNAAFNSIDICTGIGNSTHIRMDDSGNLDGQALLFQVAAHFNGFWFDAAPTAAQYPTFRARYVYNIDGVEVMRIGTGLGMGANTPPGPNSWNVNEGFVRIGEQPNTLVPVDAGNRLEIDAFPNTTFATANGNCVGSTGFSGLRFTDLTAASAPCTTAATTNVLSVDANGDVILIPGGGSYGACASPTLLTQESAVDLNAFMFHFADSDLNSKVGIGTTCGNTTRSKLIIEQNSGSTAGTMGIHVTNKDQSPTRIIFGSFIQVLPPAPNGNDLGYTAGFFYAHGSKLNKAVEGYADGLLSNGTVNYGGYFSAINGGANFGIYASAPQVAGDYAGYFDGDLYVNGPTSGMGIVFASDQNLKTNIDTITDALGIIDQLQPRSFFFDTLNTHNLHLPGEKQYGLIAQDVETILPELVSNTIKPADYDSVGNITYASYTYKTLNYNSFIPILIQGMKEQQAQIDSLQSQIASCCSSNARTSGQTNNQQDVTLGNSESIVLNDAVPNPFAEQTTITFNLPESVVKAQMLFYDAQGRLIKAVDLEGRGAGQLNVFADDLSNGIYSYALVADGQLIDTKQMVKSK